MKFNLSGLFDQWLGITVDRIKLAENADILSPMTSLNPSREARSRTG